MPEHLQLDKEKIEKAIGASLNQSDWSILNILYNNPVIINKEIAEEVLLSIAGVRSSLKKMCLLFDIKKAGGDQRIALIIEAARISGEDFQQE